MRIRVKVTDLDQVQWDELHRMVPAAGYEFAEGMTPVSVVFEAGPQVERHVDIPLMVFAKVLARLAHVNHARPAPVAELEAGAMPMGVQGGSWVREELGL